MYFIGYLSQVDIRHPADRDIRFFHHRSKQYRTGGESFQGVSGRIREPLPQRKKAVPPESEEKFDWDNIYNNRMSEEQEISLRTFYNHIDPIYSTRYFFPAIINNFL